MGTLVERVDGSTRLGRLPGTEYRFVDIGKEVRALLDETAVVPIDNYLQLPPTRRTIHASSAKLRSEIIDALPIADLLKATQSTMSSKATCRKWSDDEPERDNNQQE
jgi:hypothetical protein